MNDIFMVIAFLVLVGLLLSRMAREQRREAAYGEPLGDRGTQSGTAKGNHSLPQPMR